MKKKSKHTEAKFYATEKFTHHRFISFLIFAFAFLLGANTLHHSFAVDDDLYYVKNKVVQKGWDGIPEMFTKGSTSGFKETGRKDLYRPLVLVSFGIEKELFNNNPHASHLIQVLLYAFSCVLLYSLLNILFAQFHFVFPFLITLLFAAHPVHTEVLANIKSRDELLAFLFSVLALIAFVKPNVAQRKLIIRGLFFLFCALLCKESTVMMIFVIPLTLYFFSKTNLKQVSIVFLTSVVTTAAFLILRSQAVPLSTVSIIPNIIDNSLMAAQNFPDQIATNFLLLGMYIKLMVLPFPLSYDYSFNQIPVTGWNNVFVWLSVIVYICLLMYALLTFKRKDPVSYAILFFMLTLFMASNLYFKIDATIGLRFLYTPSLGYCIAIVFMVYKLAGIDVRINQPLSQHKIVLGIIIPVLIVFSGLTIARNADWKDNYTLFSHDVEVCSNSTRIHSNLAFQYALKAMKAPSAIQRSDLLIRCINHYQHAVKIYPQHPDAFYNMGVAYFNLGQRNNALQCFWKAKEVNPQIKDPLKELGGMYYNEHLNDSALFYFRQVLHLDNSDADAISIVQFLESRLQN